MGSSTADMDLLLKTGHGMPKVEDGLAIPLKKSRTQGSFNNSCESIGES
jgi:hypothetical protein